MNLECNFFHENNLYTCGLSGVTVVDNENANIFFSGVHQQGLNHANVETVFISSSTIPFIMPQMFTAFPSLIFLRIHNGGLTRIQPNAFANAQNLLAVEFLFNDLRAIPANAFWGASSLLSLDLFNNQIETVHESAFNGLNALELVYLDDNYLRELPANVFASSGALQEVHIPRNYLTRLEGLLFASNPLVRVIDFSNNQINAVESTIFDSTSQLLGLNMNGNVCVSGFWIINNANDLQIMREAMSTCFNNFVTDGAVKRFIIHLRGEVNLKYENGTTILTI